MIVGNGTNGGGAAEVSAGEALRAPLRFGRQPGSSDVPFRNSSDVSWRERGMFPFRNCARCAPGVCFRQADGKGTFSARRRMGRSLRGSGTRSHPGRKLTWPPPPVVLSRARSPDAPARRPSPGTSSLVPPLLTRRRSRGATSAFPPVSSILETPIGTTPITRPPRSAGDQRAASAATAAAFSSAVL